MIEAMLLPTSIDILRCIERTLETVIAPVLTKTGERSAAATIGHLLRHVALRLEHEGPILYDEIAVLRALLLKADAYFKALSAGATEAASVKASVAALLARPTEPSGYRSIASLADEVSALRQGICETLAFVLQQKQEPGNAAAQLHEEIRRYMAWEVEQEGRIIDAAFAGHGPRR
jgi:hypothetical protein